MTFDEFCREEHPDRLHVHEGSMTLYVRRAVMVRGGYVIADVQKEGLDGFDPLFDDRTLDAAFRHFLITQTERYPERALGIENPNDDMIGWLMRQSNWHLLHRPHEEPTPFFGNTVWRNRDTRYEALSR